MDFRKATRIVDLVGHVSGAFSSLTVSGSVTVSEAVSQEIRF